MPNRIIKESICESERLSECSFFARELFDRLITYADDYGRFNADTQIMYARLYPREMDSVTQDDIISALIELSGAGKISFYTSLARKGVYGCFPNWKEHQRVRDSKAKWPEPDDTEVNDWYLQRFIPLDLKVEIIERDNFKCQICGKFITSDRNAIRLAKHGCGMYHIDHIVPVSQGGRATLENLRLTCPQCNLTRKKSFTFKEIVEFSKTCGESRRLAATCGESPPESNPNPIQSESGGGTRAREAAPAGFTPPPMSRAVEAFCNKINPTPSERSLAELESFEAQMGSECCLRAIDEALDARAANWNYIRSILRSKLDQGVRCIADWDKLEEKRNARKPDRADAAGGTSPDERWHIKSHTL